MGSNGNVNISHSLCLVRSRWVISPLSLFGGGVFILCRYGPFRTDGCFLLFGSVYGILMDGCQK